MKYIRTLKSFTGFEWRRLWQSPAHKITLAFIMAFTMALSFFVGQWFLLNSATLNAFLPYGLGATVLLVSALGLWLWVSERERAVYEKLVTFPLTATQIMLGKYIAGGFILAVFVSFALSLAFTAEFLGSPDWGEILSQLLSLWLIGSVLLALVFLLNRLTKGVFSGFGVAVIGQVIFLGINWLLSVGAGGELIPSALRSWLYQHNLLSMFSRQSQGLWLLSDILVVFALIALFLVLALWRGRKDIGVKPSRQAMGTALCVSIVFFALSTLGMGGADLTVAKRNTPEKAVIDLLSTINVPVTYTLYISDDHPGLNKRQRLFADQLYYYLQNLEQKLPHVSVERTNPSRSFEAELAAKRLHLNPTIDGLGRRYYFGLEVDVGGKDEILQLNEARYSQFMRDLMETTFATARTDRKRVLLLSDLVLSSRDIRPRFIELLQTSYQVEIPDNYRLPFISNKNDLVVVFLGAELPVEALYALDQYVLRGGKVLVLEDSFLETAPNQLMATRGNDMGLGNTKTMAQLINSWGFGYTPLEIVVDPVHAGLAKPGPNEDSVPFPLWLDLPKESINTQSSVMQGLENILMPEAGHLTPLNAPDIEYTWLLKTSPQSRWVSRADLRLMGPAATSNRVQGELKERYPAMMAEGMFTPFYDERPEKIRPWFEANKDRLPESGEANHMVESVAPGKVTVIADMDFLHEHFAYEVNQGEFWVPSNDNIYMFLNTVRYLMGEPVLSGVRTKLGDLKPFTAMVDWSENLKQQQNVAQTRLEMELKFVRDEIKQVMAAALGRRQGGAWLFETLHPLEEKELQLMRQLDDVKMQTTNAYKYLNWLLALLNILFAPLLVGLLTLAKRLRKA